MNEPRSTPTHTSACVMAVAGLLHDAGKLLQPAKFPIDPQVARLEQHICPTDRRTGRPTHVHALYTAQALELARTDFGGLDRAAILRVASNHHRPSGDRFDEHLIQKADWLASGHDRRTTDQDPEDADPITALAAIMRRVTWPPDSPSGPGTDKAWCPTHELAFNPECFLPGPAQDADQYRRACETLSSRLIGGLSTGYANADACVEGINALASRLFHAVPSSRSRNQNPDVSLFDHSRLVAAFASCLAVQYDGQSEPRDADRIKGRFRLLAIGLGGIQDFIFRKLPPVDAGPGETGEKGLAKQLRARSFYISLLTHLAARRVLDWLGLPIVNLILDAGGRCLLLLPDDTANMQRVRHAIDFVQTWFFHNLAGSLRLDIGVSPALTDNDFAASGFPATYRAADDLLAHARLMVPCPLLRDAGSWSKSGWVDPQESLPVDRAPFAKQMIALGRALPRSKYLTIDGAGGDHATDIEILGYRIGLAGQRPSTGRVLSLDIHETDLTTPVLITANHVPVATEADVHLLQNPRTAEIDDRLDDETPHLGDPLTFNHIARLSALQPGFVDRHPMLAALKADVDHLGMLLGYGFGKQVSFGRLAGLSRSLDLFFKGFLTHQLRERYRYTYTIFGGGDDLFLVGPWHDILHLVSDLRGWFAAMACGNPCLSFSAGLVFAKPNTPVRQLAAAADDAIDAAKDAGRNRITLGANTLTWDQFQHSLELHRTLLAAVSTSGDQRPGMNASLLYRLLQYGRMAMAGKSAANLKWRAQMSYDLKRNLRESPANVKVQEHLAGIRSRDDASVLYTAAVFTLYHLRGGTDEQV